MKTIRDEGDDEPRGLALVLLALVFFLIVVTAEIGAAWLAVVGWHGWRRLRLAPGRVWFWLTYSVDCAWCRRRLHQAWIIENLSAESKRAPIPPRVLHPLNPTARSSASSTAPRRIFPEKLKS